MNVRRPEWDEQPFRPTARYAIANQLTMVTGVIGPPRSDRTTEPKPSVMPRQAASASARAAWTGINRPLFFLAAQVRSSMTAPMSHVSFAISPARRPALTDSNTMIRFRAGLRVVDA